jgi:REP element-mobilizing transposase RayT
MPRYIRSFVPGGTYFFTLTLEDRTSDLLVREIDQLRHIYARVCRLHPFDTLAIWCSRTISTRCGVCRRETPISRCAGH